VGQIQLILTLLEDLIQQVVLILRLEDKQQDRQK
jgi:hypothetical protein